MKNTVGSGIRRSGKSRMAWVLTLTVLLVLGMTGFAVSSSGGGDEGGHGTKGWVATDTYRVMNFAVLAIALFFILRKPISQALNSRIEGIRVQLSDLEAKKLKAEKELAEYTKQLSDLEQEAEKIVADYVRQGNEAKERILKEAESVAHKLEDQARRNIEQEFKKAKVKLQEEVLGKALIKAEEILKKTITVEDQDRLVDEYLKKVVA
jgi:F-type H+-transporting ATPase subunit b